MKPQFKTFFICLALLASLPSCMVSKCRYSGGWNVSLDRGEEYPTAQATRKSRSTEKKAKKTDQVALLDSAFTNTFYSNSSFTAELGNAYVIEVSTNAIAPQMHLKTQIDSSKNTQKSKKKKRNLLSRFLLNDYGSYTNSANDGLVYILLICFFIATAIIWGIYSLIRLIVRAHRKKAAQSNTATVSPKSAQSLGAKDSDEKLRDQNPQTTFAVNSVAKPAIEQPERTDEVADVKKGKKSKLLESILYGLLAIVLLVFLSYSYSQGQ